MKNTENRDVEDFVKTIESLKAFTSNILLKSGQLMPANIVAQLNIPDEYKDFFPGKN